MNERTMFRAAWAIILTFWLSRVDIVVKRSTTSAVVALVMILLFFGAVILMRQREHNIRQHAVVV